MNTWQDFEIRRKRLNMSRAEMCRRAGVSETTAFKGLRNRTRPSDRIAALMNVVLTAASETNDEEECPNEQSPSHH